MGCIFRLISAVQHACPDHQPHNATSRMHAIDVIAYLQRIHGEAFNKLEDCVNVSYIKPDLMSQSTVTTLPT